MYVPWQRVFLVTAITLFLTVCGVGYREHLALAQQDPDFSNVSDILQGRRILLPVDDLVLNALSGVGPGVTNLVLKTANSQVSTQESFSVTGSPVPSAAIAMGRLLNLPRDVIVTMTEGLLNITDQDHFGKGFSVSGFPRGMVMADFTGNGFAEIALLTADTDGGTSGLLRIVAANDVNNVDAGLFVSDGVGPQFINFDINLAMTAGDFDGDGKAEVAIAQPAPLNGGELLMYIYKVVTNQDGTIANSALQQAASFTSAVPGVAEVALTAGDYDGASNATTGLPDDELVIAYRFGANLVMNSLDVVPDSNNPDTYQLVFKGNTALSTVLDTDANAIAGLASGRLDWFGATDQVVVTFNSQGTGIVSIFTFDSELNFQAGGGNSFSPLVSMALGNYDQTLGQNDPPNLQIAVLEAVCCPGIGSFHLIINQVDPSNNFALSQVSDTQILQDLSPLEDNALLLVAGDTQGRSLLLGPPNKVTITKHYQPETILGAPPMHVDWITPDGTQPPVEFNVTAVPDNYFSQYQTKETQSDQSSRKSTTSFSYATKESSETKVSLGVPLVASVSATLTTAAEQTHNNVVSKTYNTYTSKTFDASTQTGFDDHLWFTGKRFNLYLYPVIGHCIQCADAAACAEAADSCPAGTRPLVVQFSGPDMVFQEDIDAANVEWYQPVHEVGNVLSYPWTPTQLQTMFPGLNALSPDPPPTHFTDSSITTLQANWAQGMGSEVTHGSTSTFSFSTSESISASATAVGDFFTVGASGTDTFSFNTSQSVSTLNSTQEQVGESTGVGIHTPGTFQDPATYQYAWQSLIFGQQDPPGTLQHISLDTDIQSTGILRTAFTADPTNSSAGPWWAVAYTRPDVALNHPARWTLSTQTSAPNQPPPSPCRRVTPTSTAMDCLSFNPANTADLPASEFHWMKGLFITPAEANGTGPQTILATAGDQLLLQARVYNYSLTDMPAGTVVRVQFYGQEWDNTTHNFIGPSFFIGEDTRSPLPGFNSTSTGGEQPNWTLASTTFDTTAYSDKYVIFWVVVWMENGGSLVPEVPDHGLTAIPGANLTSMADVPIESHSNNVGYYRQPLFIQPQTNTQNATVRAATTTAEEALIIETIQVSPLQVAPHDKVKVRATFRTGETARDGLSVLFYDGDPLAGGKAFDHEVIPHIRAQDSYTTQVLFQPRTCGRHTVFVVAAPGAATPAEGTATVEVNIDPVAGLAGLRRLVADAGLPPGIEDSLDAKLKTAQRAFEKGKSTAALNKLDAFRNKVNAQRGKKIPAETAEALLATLDRIVGCIDT